MIPVPFDIAGQTGGHRSVQFNSEVTQNMYLDLSDGNRKGCHDFPGLKPFGTQSGADRGCHVMAGNLFRICGENLYQVSKAGVYTLLGIIPGPDYATFADDGTNLYLVANGGLFKYNGTVVSTISQSVVTGLKSIAYINRQFILAGDDGIFATSDVADGDTYNALNFAEAEVQPDALQRPYVFNQLIYMLGDLTTELWYNTGTGNPPFARRDTSLVNVGIAGKHAVTNTDSFLYWLGDDRKVYQCVGASARNVITDSVFHIIDGFSKIDDCICSKVVIEAQDFIVFSFPTANYTFAYSEKYDYWIKLSSGSSGDRWYGNCIARAYDKNLVTDYRNGNTYELDLKTYTDNGDTRIRDRTLPNFTGGPIRHDGQITVGKVRVNMQTGVGLTTGQGVAPVIMCQFSPDGGETWQGEQFVSIGAGGSYKGPVDFWDFSTGYDVKLRIRCSDPVFLSMFDGVVEMEAAGF